MSNYSGHDTRLNRLEFLMIINKEVHVAQAMATAYRHTDAYENAAKFRILVRTVHSNVEALIAFMKLDAIHAFETGRVKFTPKQLKGLKEIHVNSKGKEVFARPTFMPNARLAVRCYDEATGGPTALGKRNLQLPAKLKDWARLRNRITHPKYISDLKITEPDIQLLPAVVTWFTGLAAWVTTVERGRVEGSYADTMDTLAQMSQLSKLGHRRTPEMKDLLQKLMDVQEVAKPDEEGSN